MLQKLTRQWTPTDIAMWAIGICILLFVIWGAGVTLLSGKYSGGTWLDLIIAGVTRGSIYALIALGYTLVYGVLRMINFAHGDVFMAGPFIAYFVAVPLAQAGLLDASPLFGLLGVVLILAIAMAVSTVIAVLLERIAYRPLRNAPRLIPLITAIGASFFLEYSFLGFFGSGVYAYPDITVLQGTLGGLPITKTQFVVIASAFIMLAGLYAFVQYTKTGKAMRAVSEDKDAARLMGIDVDRVIVITFAVGGAMAGAAGVLYALLFRQVNFIMGFIPGLKAFTAAVLGGIGNVPGAMLGGLSLGIIESLFPNLVLDGLGIPAPYQLQDAVAFVMLVLILIFRPTGILGERLAAKKA